MRRSSTVFYGSVLCLLTIFLTLRMYGMYEFNREVEPNGTAPVFLVLYKGDAEAAGLVILGQFSVEPEHWLHDVEFISRADGDSIDRFFLSLEDVHGIRQSIEADRSKWEERGVRLSSVEAVDYPQKGLQVVTLRVMRGETAWRFRYGVDLENEEILPITYGYFSKRSAFLSILLGAIFAIPVWVLVWVVSYRSCLRKLRFRQILVWIFSFASWAFALVAFVLDHPIVLVFFLCSLMLTVWFTVLLVRLRAGHA